MNTAKRIPISNITAASMPTEACSHQIKQHLCIKRSNYWLNSFSSTLTDRKMVTKIFITNMDCSVAPRHKWSEWNGFCLFNKSRTDEGIVVPPKGLQQFVTNCELGRNPSSPGFFIDATCMWHQPLSYTAADHIFSLVIWVCSGEF